MSMHQDFKPWRRRIHQQNSAIIALGYEEIRFDCGEKNLYNL